MSTENKAPVNSRLREGYQPLTTDRGYQPAGSVQKGYQPTVQLTVPPQPPPVGSTSVIPSANSGATQAPTAAQKEHK